MRLIFTNYQDNMIKTRIDLAKDETITDLLRLIRNFHQAKEYSSNILDIKAKLEKIYQEKNFECFIFETNLSSI